MWWSSQPLSESKRASLATKAHLLAVAGHMKRAERLIARVMIGPDNHTVLACAFHIELRKEQYASAEQLALRRLKLCGPTEVSKLTLDCYDHLGHACKGLGRTVEAEGHFLRCLSIGEHLQDPQLVAQYCNLLGNLSLADRDFTTADSYYYRALQVAPATATSVRIAIKDGLFMSNILQRKFADAEPLGEECLRHYESKRNLTNMARISAMLSNAYLESGQLDRSEVQAHYSFRLHRDLGNVAAMGVLYNNLGLVEMRRGNLERANSLLSRALEINELKGRNAGIVQQYANFAAVALSSDKVLEARQYCEIARRYLDETPQSKRLAWTLTGHEALISVALYEFELAESKCTELIVHHEAERQYTELARYTGVLSSAKEGQGDLQNALQLRQLAVDICREHAITRELARHLGFLGRVQRILGFLDEADSTLAKARQELLPDDILDQAQILVGQALVCLRRQNFERAAVLGRQALELFDPRETQLGVMSMFLLLEEIQFSQGDAKTAHASFANAMRIGKNSGNLDCLALQLCCEARRNLSEGDLGNAERQCQHLDEFNFNDPGAFVAAQRAMIEGRISLMREDRVLAARRFAEARELCQKNDLPGLSKYVARYAKQLESSEP